MGSFGGAWCWWPLMRNFLFFNKWLWETTQSVIVTLLFEFTKERDDGWIVRVIKETRRNQVFLATPKTGYLLSPSFFSFFAKLFFFYLGWLTLTSQVILKTILASFFSWFLYFYVIWCLQCFLSLTLKDRSLGYGLDGNP